MKKIFIKQSSYDCFHKSSQSIQSEIQMINRSSVWFMVVNFTVSSGNIILRIPLYFEVILKKCAISQKTSFKCYSIVSFLATAFQLVSSYSNEAVRAEHLSSYMCDYTNRLYNIYPRAINKDRRADRRLRMFYVMSCLAVAGVALDKLLPITNVTLLSLRKAKDNFTNIPSESRPIDKKKLRQIPNVMRGRVNIAGRSRSSRLMLSEIPLFTNGSCACISVVILLLTGGRGGLEHQRRISSGSPLISDGGMNAGEVTCQAAWQARRARGPASAAGLLAAARRTWPQVSINRCARRGRGTFMSREQLTAEPRKHESRPFAPLTPSSGPAPPVLTYSAQGAVERLYIDVRSQKQSETFPCTRSRAKCCRRVI